MADFLRMVAENVVTDGQTDGLTDRHAYQPSTVTLAAHARRGLMKSTKVQTLGELRMRDTAN